MSLRESNEVLVNQYCDAGQMSCQKKKKKKILDATGCVIVAFSFFFFFSSVAGADSFRYTSQLKAETVLKKEKEKENVSRQSFALKFMVIGSFFFW